MLIQITVKKEFSVKLNNIFLLLVIVTPITSAIADTTSILKIYSNHVEKCKKLYGNEISMKQSQCLNHASINLAKTYNYPYIELLEQANTHRIELTRKVEKKEISAAQMRFRMKKMFKQIEKVSNNMDNSKNIFLVHHD